MRKTTLRVSGLVESGALSDKPDPTKLIQFKDENEFSSENTFLISIDQIVPNPFQPRRQFLESEIQELAQSIELNGLIQPIAVRFNVQQKNYQIIAGERRYRAFKMLGKTEIPTAVFVCDETDLAVRAIVENVDRKDLSDYEIGKAIRNLVDKFSYKTQLAEKCGFKREDMYRYFAFEDLPEFALEKLNENPWLFGRAAASDIKRFLSKVEEKNIPIAHSILANAIQLVENKELDQTKIVQHLASGLKSELMLSSENITKRDEFIIEGKKIGYFSSSPNGVMIKFSKGILNDEKKEELQTMITHFLEQVIDNKKQENDTQR